MNDQKFFDMVAEELRIHQLDEGLWLSAITACNDDRERARKIYFSLRVEQLKREHADNLKALKIKRVPLSVCPNCDFQGPFPGRVSTLILRLLSLLPVVYGCWYFYSEKVIENIRRAIKSGSSNIPDDLVTQLLLCLVFFAPFLVIYVSTRGSVRCPSCRYIFWYKKNAPRSIV